MGKRCRRSIAGTENSDREERLRLQVGEEDTDAVNIQTSKQRHFPIRNSIDKIRNRWTKLLTTTIWLSQQFLLIISFKASDKYEKGRKKKTIWGLTDLSIFNFQILFSRPLSSLSLSQPLSATNISSPHLRFLYACLYIFTHDGMCTCNVFYFCLINYYLINLNKMVNLEKIK